MNSEKLLSPAKAKVAIMAELARGAKANDLAVKYDVNPMTIGSWKRKARMDAEKGDILEVAVEVEPVVLEAVAQELKAKAKDAGMPAKQYAKFDTQLDKLKDGATSLQLLDTAFHTTMMNLLQWANDRITDDMKIGEWTQLVNGITTMHTALFAKGADSTINIMQGMNSQSSAKVEKFKGSFRV